LKAFSVRELDFHPISSFDKRAGYQFEEESSEEMTDMDVDAVLQEDPRDSNNPAFLTPMQVFSPP
jgi:hypothetical protein